MLLPDINQTDSGTVTLQAFCDGAESSAAVFRAVDGGGHTISSIASCIGPTLEGLFGKQNRDFETAEGDWAVLPHQHLAGTDAACCNWCVEAVEECDDGNPIDGDGCPATCVAGGSALPIVSFGGLAALVLGLLGAGVPPNSLRKRHLVVVHRYV